MWFGEKKCCLWEISPMQEGIREPQMWLEAWQWRGALTQPRRLLGRAELGDQDKLKPPHPSLPAYFNIYYNPTRPMLLAFCTM